MGSPSSASSSFAPVSAQPIFQNASRMTESRASGRRNYRDAIPAERADPERVADLDERRAGAELRRVRLRNDVSNRERSRIDFHGFPALTGLADGVQRAIARPV